MLQSATYPELKRYWVTDPSLVLFLPLYQLDGAVISSKDHYGHLATVTGALWTPQGSILDGVDDKIAVPFHSAFNISGQLTIEYWLKRTAATDGCNLQMGDLSGSWVVRDNAAAEGFAIYDGTWEKLPITVLAIDTLFHIVITYDANKLVSYYRNGVLGETATFTKALPTIDAALTIGHETDAGFGNTWFGGTIGGVKIYNRALTALEIQQNYLATKWRYKV